MGTRRRLLICIGSLLVFLTCIQAQAAGQQQQQQTTDEDWDSVHQNYEAFDLNNIDTEVQQDTEEYEEDEEQQSDAGSPKVKIITTPAPVYRSQNPYHNSMVCTTFGNSHFKTFDGDIYHFPGQCNYHFVRHCKSNYEDFNIQIRRAVRETLPVISVISMKVEGVDIIVDEKSVTVNDENVQKLPFSVGGIQISKSGGSLRIYSKIGLEMIWKDDSILLELSEKYANQTCGLCGDYNGIPIYNEFIVNNAQLSNIQFGNLHKINGPEERCEDTKEEVDKKCDTNVNQKQLCANVLNGNGLKDCHGVVDVQKYIELCEQDFCNCQGNLTGFCVCNIITEYSRQCTHAGGKPKNWRSASICPLKCSYNLQFKECGTACPDTCTNPERSLVCDEHCTDGCFCPAGTVFDDITRTGCIAKEKCACTYNGDVYPTGTGYSEKCQECTCQGGKWACVKKACFGTCSFEGGSHITTFDLTRYNFHGDCVYTLSKLCDSSLFTVLAEIHKCGHTDTETCLKSISLSLNGGREFILVKKCGSVYINSIYTQLPMSSATITMYKPTSFYIILQAVFGLQIKIQLVPTMQVYVIVDPKFMNQTCGLCGNFNNIQADDFKSPSGVIEGSGSSFGNLWKNQLDCPNVKNNFEDPCAIIGETEKYASHWCDMMLASDGPFASCHKTVNPDDFHKNCMFDSCNSENKEHSMCAALSSYVYACSRDGVDLRGWRTNVCHSYTTTCSPGFVYRYTVNTCPLTCKSLSESDKICGIDFAPIDGCTCADGTYLDESGNCVLPALCSCYYKGTTVSPGEVIHDSGTICTCTNGRMECIGVNPVEEKVCEQPMVYFDCESATAEAKQTVCQKSCATIDTECYSSQCVSGCVCPDGLVYDDRKEACIPEEQCPCTLNDDIYSAGETAQVKCNTCTCKNRKWECTTNTCLGTCATYGDGHYLTFDNRRYRFNGNCWYTLAQDYCTDEATDSKPTDGKATNGTFRIVTENVPCGSKGVTCSKSIRLYLGNYELILKEQKFEVIKKDYGQYVFFKVRQMGLYLVVEAENGLALVWDKKNTILMKLDPKYEGKICGLCGNYDGNAANDYITRSQSVVGDVLEFGNSWKLSQRCPNAVDIQDTCDSNPYRKAWSQKQCSLITSGTFASCHALVNPVKYYEACVNDACACDTGGDCDCLCTAVGAYAQACSEAGQCISWRSPNICPVFCDFYNQQGHCEWHYKACGAPCMKTCMNPTGVCLNNLIGLEGCYPNCPVDRPYFDEESMQCVASCNCYDKYGEEYKPGEKMPSESRCSVCECKENGKECTEAKACCHYEGKEFLPGDIVYHTADGTGGCIYATCSDNSTLERKIDHCPTTTSPPTTFDFTTPPLSSEWHPGTTVSVGPSTSSTPTKATSIDSSSSERPSSSTSGTVTPGPSVGHTSTPAVSPTICVEAYDCTWSEWYDVSRPENGDGDMERFEDIEAQGHKVCKNPKDVECKAKEYPYQSLKDLGQDVTCSRKSGLVCLNSKNSPMCHNYQIRIECCNYRECTTISSTSGEESTPPPETSSPEIITQSPTSKEQPSSLPSQSTSEPGTSKSPSSSPPSISTSPNTSSPPGIVTESSGKTPASSEDIPKTTPASPTTTCVYKMECRWTPWYDNNKPDTKSDGGESESVKDITSKGYDVCRGQEVENKIECEAVDDKGITIADNSQKVSCDLNDGLNCRNREQINKEKCYNYRIRIECCAQRCEPIPTPNIHTTETTKQSTTSGEFTTKGTTTGSPSESLQPDSTKSPSSTPSTSTLSTKSPVPDTSIPSISSEVTPSQTTVCVNKMKCRWTPWYDNNEPSLKSDGGDTENVGDIKSMGTEVCTDREVEDKIECEAINDKGESIDDNNQKVSCDVKNGLSCKNRDQSNKEKCYNYKIRILCCEEYCEPLPTSKITTTETSEPKTTVGETTLTTSTPETGPTKHPSTGIQTTKTPGPETSYPSENTSPPSTSSSSSEVTTSVSPTTCVHKMECRWTPWYDINRPTLQNDGGDSESPEDIKSKGYEICTDREVEHKIECEAIDQEGATIANNQQILTCVLGNGLTCRNRDQKKQENCHNYRIRVECCASYCAPELTTPTTLPTQSSVPSSAFTVPTTSSVTEPSSTSEDCEKVRASECHWTEWFNENKPTEDIDGEDNENSDNLRAKGIEVCKQGEIENQIQCKAEQYSELTSENTAQKATCNVKEGLICKNKDQPEEKCHDYSVRIECCSEKFVKFCGKPTTPSSSEMTSITTTTSITKPSSPESETPPQSTLTTGTKTPGVATESTSGTETPRTSSPSSKSSTEITSAPATVCEKKMACHWTPWYDNNTPNPKSNGGDIEKYEDITSKGIAVCKDGEVENNIECEAIDKNGVTISDNHQKMTCDLKNGLTCFNKEQKNKEKCYNYRIRFECCAEHCEKLETDTTVGTSTTASTTTLSEHTSTGKPQTSTSLPTSTQSSTTTSVTEPGSPTPEDCDNFRKAECYWTDWFNKETPTSDINGGDSENTSKLKAAGIEVCINDQIENQIECKAEKYSDLAYGNIDQKFTCNVKEGLICKNKDQPGEKCNDYSIRIECCSKKFVKFCGESTTPSAISSSTEVTSIPTTTSVSSTGSSTPGRPSSSTDETYTKTPTHTSSITSFPTSTSSTTKTESTSSPHSTTTSCEKFRQNECRWTEWLNTQTPSSDINGEDKENLHELKSKGIEICKNEEVENEIECKADKYSDLSYKDTNQVVTCNLIDGLICKNKEQKDEPKQCLDYEVRIECCSKRFIESCAKSTPSPTSPSSSEVTKSPMTLSVSEPSTPGSTSMTDENSTPGTQTSGETSIPSKSTSGGTSTPGSPTGGETPTPGRTTSSETSTPSSTGRQTSGETSTPGETTTSGSPQTSKTPSPIGKSSTESPSSPSTGESSIPDTQTSGETSTPGIQTSGETSTTGTPTSGGTSTPGRPTGGENSTPESTRSGETSTPGRPTGGETSTPSTSGRPTSAETSTPGKQTSGENSTPGIQTSSETSTTGSPTSGATSTPGGPTGGETSTSGRPTSGETSTPGRQTNGETSTTGRPTSGGTSTPGRPTGGENSTPESTTSGETSTPGRPTGGETSTPSTSGRPTSAETSTPGKQTSSENSTPGIQTSGETSTTGSPTSGETSTPGGPTGGETSTSERPTSGETSNPGRQTNGETSTTGRPTSGGTSTPGRPTGGENSTPESTTSGETSTPGRPTGGETSTPSTSSKPTSAEISTPGKQTSSENSTPGIQTSGETSTTGRPTSGETSTPGGPTGGETSTSERPTSGETSTPGRQTSGETSTTGRPTSGGTSTPGRPTGGENSTPESTRGETSTPGRPTGGETSTPSTSSKPTSAEISTPGRQTSGENSTPGIQTSGETSTTGRPTSGVTSTPGGPTGGETSTSGRPTSGETSTPSRQTSGETSTPGRPTSGENSTPGIQTSGETSTTGRPTSGGTSTPGRPTGGENSTPESKTSGETSTPGRPTGGETSTPSTSGRPTSAETSTPGKQTSGDNSTPGIQTSGETSTTGRPTSGVTSTPGGPTGGETSTSGRPTSGESSTPGRQTSGENSTPGIQTSGETSTTGRPTSGGTSTPGRPTGGENSTPESKTSGETSTPGRPTGGETSTPSTSGRPTSAETSTPGKQTSGENSTPGIQTSGETSTTGRPTSGVTTTPGGPTGGETSTSGRPTSGETSTPGRQTSGETSTPGKLTTGENSTPGIKTSGETSTTGRPTSGGTSTPGRPTGGENSTPESTRSGETSTPGRPTGGETSTPSTSGRPTSAETSTPGKQTSGENSTPGIQTSGETSTTGRPTSDVTSTPGGPTGGETSTSGRPTSGETSTPGRQTIGETSTPGRLTSGENSTPGIQTSGETSTTGRPTSGGTSTPGRPTGGDNSTPERTTSGETSTPGRPTGGETSTPSNSDRPTSAETSTPGKQTSGETTTGRPTSGVTSTPGGPTGGETSTSGRPTSGETSTPGRQTSGEISTPGRPTSGETSTPGRQTSGETSTTGRPTSGGTSTPSGPTGGETSTSGRPTSGETSTPGKPTGGENSTPGIQTSGETSTPGRQTGGETSTPSTSGRPTSGETSTSGRPTSGETFTTGIPTSGETSSPGGPTGGESSTTGRPTSGETSTTGRPTGGETSTPGRQTSGETSTTGRPTSGETSTPGRQTGGETSTPSTSGRPTSGETSTPGTQTSGETSTPGRQTSGETSTTGRPTSAGTSTPGGPTSGETSTSGRPTSGETSTPGKPTGGETSTPSTSGRPTSGETSTPGRQTNGEYSTPGLQTSGETSTTGRPTSGETSTPGRQTGGETSTPSTSGRPTSGETSTPGRQTSGETSTPGKQTSGETSTTGRPTSGGTSTPGGPTGDETSTSGRPTSGEISTPGKPTGGETSTPSTSGSPTSGETSTPGRQTSGETYTTGRPTSGETSTPGRQTGGETSTPSTSGRPTSGETSTPGRQTSGETSTTGRPTSGGTSTPGGPTGGETSTSGRPTSGETSIPGKPTGGETSTPSTSGRPTSGETSTPGRQTSGETSTSGRPTSGETSTPGKPTGGETSTPSTSGRQTSGETSTTGRPTSGGTSTPSGPTFGETSTSGRPTSGETSTPGRPTGGENSTPGRQTSGETSTTGRPTSGETSTTGRPTSGETSTPGRPTGGETSTPSTSGRPTSGETSTPNRQTSGETSTTGRPTNGETSTPGGLTGGETSTSGKPTSGETSTPGRPTGGETSTPSTSGRPTSGETSTPNRQTSGETSTTGRPTNGETSTPGGLTGGETSTSGKPTSGETSTPGKPTTGENSTPDRQTSGETSTTGRPASGGTPTPGGPTDGETSTSGRPTSGETSTPDRTTGGETSTPGTPTSGETSTPGQSTSGENSTPGRPTGGETSTPSISGRPTSGETSTPGRTTSGETSTIGTPTNGEETTSSTSGSSVPTQSPGSPSISEISTPITHSSGETSTTVSPSSSTSSSCKILRESECHWTIWHNTNKPSSDINGEEKENSGQLRSSGIEVCKNEEVENEIECKAEKYSDISYKDADQIVTCNVKDGLICKNKEQTVEPKQCLDYTIRIECCTKRFIESCGELSTSTTSTSSSEVTPGSTPAEISPGVTTGTTGSPPLITSSSISGTTTHTVTVTSTSGTTASPINSSTHTTSSTSVTSSTAILATTSGPETATPSPSQSPTVPPSAITVSCFCKVKDEIYSPGDIIYHKEDKDGCVFYAICSKKCEIERHVGECSTPGTTPEVTTLTSTELTYILDVTSGKPTLNRPSKRPPTKPGTGTTGEPDTGTSGEPGTSTEPNCGPCECLMPTCGTGYRVVSHMPPGACCAKVTCVPDSVCVVDNTIYQSGSTIPQPKGVCQNCECSKDEQDESGFYAVKCQQLQCDKTCEEGYAYAEKEGECCGECVPKQCIIKGEKGEKGEQGEDNKPVKIKIGDSYHPEGSTCSYYECDEEDDKPMLTKVKKVCQELDISKCEEDTVKYDEDGCCQTCTLKTEVKVIEKPVLENCNSHKNLTVLEEGDCKIEVEVTYCRGPCMGNSTYSMESQGMDHKCSCCTELEVAERQVEMLCANGQRRVHHYKDVIRCGCSVATCEPLTSAEIQQPDQQQKTQTASKFRRR